MTELKPITELVSEPNKSRRSNLPTPDEIGLSVREELVLALCEVGISLRKAEHLVDRFPESRIRRQLAWLPKRGAR